MARSIRNEGSDTNEIKSGAKSAWKRSQNRKFRAASRAASRTILRSPIEGDDTIEFPAIQSNTRLAGLRFKVAGS